MTSGFRPTPQKSQSTQKPALPPIIIPDEDPTIDYDSYDPPNIGEDPTMVYDSGGYPNTGEDPTMVYDSGGYPKW